MTDLVIHPVAPIGTRRSLTHINRGHADDGKPLNHSWEMVDHDAFPPEAEAAGRELRRLRVEVAGLTLREAAKALGISIVQLSDLERGRARCDGDAVVEAYKRAKGEGA